MDNSTRSDGDIPLFCNICPKKPRFSDTSHLLTHIASKGHLSSYFKAQVKGRQDSGTQALVDEYDGWFAQYNIQGLLSARLCQKEKRARGDNTQSRRGSGAVENKSTVLTPLYSVQQDQLRSQTLDPLLSCHIKCEEGSYSHLSEAFNCVNDYPVHPFGTLESNSDWNNLPYDMSSFINHASIKREFDDSAASLDSDLEDAFTSGAHKSAIRSVLSNSTQSIAVDEDLVMDETILDSAKMKGVFWEGMALFDSATPEMKRRRNQKKAFSVAQQLKATSETVRPFEMVFDDNWSHRRTRLITGNPTVSDGEESHLDGESTPEPIALTKKQPARRKRRPLAELDVNARNLPSQRNRVAHAKGSVKQHHKTKVFQDDNDLTFQSSRPKRRKGFSIHRDDSGPDIIFSKPMPLGSLLSDHRASTAGTMRENHSRDGIEGATPASCPHGFPPFVHPHLPTMTNFRTTPGVSGLANTTNLATFGPIHFANQPLFQYGQLSFSNVHYSPHDFVSSHSHLRSDMYLPHPHIPMEDSSEPSPTTQGAGTTQGSGPTQDQLVLAQALTRALFTGEDHKIVTNDESTISIPSEDEAE